MPTVVYGSPSDLQRATAAKPTQAAISMAKASLVALGNVITAGAKGLYEGLVNTFNDNTTGETARRIDAISNNIDNINRLDGFVMALKVGAMQTANFETQRVIMANPLIRSMLRSGRLEGYGDQYVNVGGVASGEMHHDYRIMTDGAHMVHTVEDEENSRDVLKVSFYKNVDTSEDKLFSSWDKNKIAQTWGACNRILEDGDIDPTSPNNALLG